MVSMDFETVCTTNSRFYLRVETTSFLLKWLQGDWDDTNGFSNSRENNESGDDLMLGYKKVRGEDTS